MTFEKKQRDYSGDKEQRDAANLLAEVILNFLQGKKGEHPQTAIAAAGALAGHQMLLDANLNLSKFKPGEAVFADAVNARGPGMIEFMARCCADYGFEGEGGWDLDLSEDQQPYMSVLELIRELRSFFESILDKHLVMEREKAQVAARAAIVLIKKFSDDLDPAMGKAIALRALALASKTAPLPTFDG